MTEQEAWEYVIAKELDVQYQDNPHQVIISYHDRRNSVILFQGTGDDIVDAVVAFRKEIVAARVRTEGLLAAKIQDLDDLYCMPDSQGRNIPKC